MLIFGGYDTKPGKYTKVTLLVIIALRSSSGLVLNGKIMYIKATSHCLIRYQSIVGELCTIQSEDKFTQSIFCPAVDIYTILVYYKGIQKSLKCSILHKAKPQRWQSLGFLFRLAVFAVSV